MVRHNETLFDPSLDSGAALLSYRTFFNVKPGSTGGEVISVALGQMWAWLKSKGYDPDKLVRGLPAEIGGTAADPVTGTLTHHHDRDGSESVLFVMREVNDSGAWTTQLVLHDPHNPKIKAWVWLEIDGPEGLNAGVPRLARDLLAVLDADDRVISLNDTAATLTPKEVPDLIQALESDERRSPIFVAGIDGSVPFSNWRRKVNELLKKTTGLAPSFVLDAEATRLFNSEVGVSHGIQPFTIRTYLPGFEPDDELDALRHRILSPDSINAALEDPAQKRRLTNILGARAREMAVSQPLPRYATRVASRLHERANTDLLDSIPEVAALPERTPIVAAPPSAQHQASDQVSGAEASLLKALADALTQVFGFNSVSPESVTHLVQLANDGITARQIQKNYQTLKDQYSRIAEDNRSLEEIFIDAEDTRASIQKRLEDEQIEHRDTADERDMFKKRVSSLERMLQKLAPTESDWQQIAEATTRSAAPDNFFDLLEQLKKGELFPRLVWTGDDSIVHELDDHQVVGAWVNAAWSALNTLDDYADSYPNEFQGSVEEYIKNTPAGRTSISKKKHAENESGDVKSNPKYREPRMLNVPDHIDPSGKVFMGAHFKIARSGNLSPRMHYHNAVSNDGKIYVGYLGPHLPNGKKN